MKKQIRFRRSVKAISPVIAVLLMIAIAVAASLVAYAWVMGYIGFTQTKVGKAIQIQSISSDMVYVQNVGDSRVTLVGLYVNGALDGGANVTESVPWDLDPSQTVAISSGISWASDASVTVKVVTDDGMFTELKKTFSTSGGGGGSTTPTPTPTPSPSPPPDVTRVSQVARTNVDLTGGTASFASTPTEDNLLVVIAGHRVGNPGTNHAPTLAGYTLQEVEYDYTATTSSRRIIAVFTKIAGAGESNTVSIDWHDSALLATDEGWVILQEFTGATTYTKVASDGNGNQNSAGNLLNIPASPLSVGSNENILAIGAMVWRDSPSNPSFSNLGGVVTASMTAYGQSAFAYSQGSATVLQTTVTWTSTARLASGLLVLFACS